ncbi:hypothetical protein Q8A73_005303 [Channa argus]|nr:hypothetical protein Q8A73_005303 [Channa argus]
MKSACVVHSYMLAHLKAPAENERGQRLPDVDTAQQQKLRERQRFFEEVFQHDVDVYLSSAHLCIRDYKRPPIGSISSMEVNVDLLDQMELIDISDQEALDVFFSSGGEEGMLTSPLPVQHNNNNEEVISNGLFRHVLEGLEAKSRMSSISSHSSFDSQTTSANGGCTPVVGSDDEETHTSNVTKTAAPPDKEIVYYLSSATCSDLLSRQRRSWIINSFTIEEGHAGPFPYVLGKIIIERDYLVYFDLYGEGADEEPKGVISIDKESGALIIHKAVDYEEKKLLKLVFEVRKKDFAIDTKLGLEISIRDINDNPPRFQSNLYEIHVAEDCIQGTDLLRVVAHDRDQSGTPNSTFHYEIKHTSPNTANTEFFIDAESGAISFKGCLDHEVAKMYTLLVETKDHGEVVSLSSSTTVVIYVQDGNNHLPTISGQTPLDFEKGAHRELSISVVNEAPYVSCKVKKRTSSGLWTIDTSEGSSANQPHSVKVIIEVEDANDPPVFSPTVKEAVLKENTPTGTWVEKVTAVDPDTSHAHDFVYKVGHDPAGWVMVEPQTGDITTVNSPDRESPHVVNGVYNILLHAVDNGNPPLTGKSTLQIHVTDENDNVPQLTMDYLDVCASHNLIITNITAFDLDEYPFGGPFTFELLGDVKGKWKLDPSYGYTVGLVKQPDVNAGSHIIDLKISDMQGQFGVYNLSVTVTQRNIATKAASGAFGIIFASLFLLLCLLMGVVVSCKKEFATLQISDSSGDTLLKSNIEKPGTDCKVPDSVLQSPVVSIAIYKDPFNWQSHYDGTQYMSLSKMVSTEGIHRTSCPVITACCVQQEDMGTVNFHYTRDSSYALDAALETLLHWRLSTLQEIEDDLLNYEPHLYEEEGDSDDPSDLDTMTIPSDDSFQIMQEDLGPKFKQLALICKTPHTEI